MVSIQAFKTWLKVIVIVYCAFLPIQRSKTILSLEQIEESLLCTHLTKHSLKLKRIARHVDSCIRIFNSKFLGTYLPECLALRSILRNSIA